jgi:hypothetical protein
VARTPGNGRDVMDGPARDVAASGLRGWAFVREGKGWSARGRLSGPTAGGRRGRQQGRWPAGDALRALSRSAAVKAEVRRGCGRRKVKLTGGTRLSVAVGGERVCGISWAGAGRRRCGPWQGCVRARGLGRGTASGRAEQAGRAGGVSWLDGFRPGLVRE